MYVINWFKYMIEKQLNNIQSFDWAEKKPHKMICINIKVGVYWQLIISVSVYNIFFITWMTKRRGSGKLLDKRSHRGDKNEFSSKSFHIHG